MRIAVPEIVRRGEQRARVAQVGADRSVFAYELGVDDAALPAQPQPVRAIFAISLDREDGVEAIRLAERKVVLAMVRRHVDQAGARIGRDEITGKERARLGEETAETVHWVAGDGSG